MHDKVFWKVANGIRLTGMPGFNGSLSTGQLWQVTLLLSNANKLPAKVQSALHEPLRSVQRILSIATTRIGRSCAIRQSERTFGGELRERFQDVRNPAFGLPSPTRNGWSEEIEGGFRFGQLAKFEAAREDESATRAGKARWKVFGSSRCVAMHNSAARPRI